MAARSLNDYFARWEMGRDADILTDVSSPDDEECQVCSAVENEYRKSNALQATLEPKEATPESAPVRLVVLRPGMPRPNPPLAQPCAF